MDITGPRMKNVTPAMRQYLDIKAENSDAILFFRMGDFYEMFFEDARLASRVLGITLTSRDKDRDIPMCGVPYHAALSYIAKLVKEGHKVAICEQVEDPDEAKGIVERAVVKVVTPGIVIEEELLDPKTNNFIAAVVLKSRKCGFAYMDASTGEFRLTEFPEDALNDEMKRIRPTELLVEETLRDRISTAESPVKKVTGLSRFDFGLEVALERLNKHFGTLSLDGFGCSDMVEGARAAGALLYYIKETQKAPLQHVKKCIPYHTDDYLVMDHSTRRSLEVMQNSRTSEREGSLLELLDKTKTAMGGRRLRSWLLYPLKDITAIGSRHDAVSELVERRDARSMLRELLSEVYDLERLVAKVSIGSAGPRDMVSLKCSLKKIPALKQALAEFNSSFMSDLASSLDSVNEAAQAIEYAISDPAPISVKDGGVIREGYSAELDELRKIGSGGKDWIARLEAAERAKTGINSLKVGYNRVFGYYIEVTKTNLSSVPDEYIRKQTLVNAERFITPELKEWEDKILTAEERALDLEASLFTDIKEKVSRYSERVQRTADTISTLDAIAALAEVSQVMDYARPVVYDGNAIEIVGGRHPVIEAARIEGFVANDLKMDRDNQILILTGPNMAGKSTYLRQNALIVLMAQIGCFVPAQSARIGVIDRIFSRVGASDDLSRGQSTFMVEMNETANILNNATDRSLIILDEIGRGTSTFDGLSIAWAVVEYLHDHPGVMAKTLFATHYHELTDLSLTKEKVKNYNMAVKEWDDKIIFLRKVLPGGSSRSYGIQVARLAGLPSQVIGRATEILKNLETGELNDSGVPKIAVSEGPLEEQQQMSLLGKKDKLREEIDRLDVNNMTPLEALMALNKMKETHGN